MQDKPLQSSMRQGLGFMLGLAVVGVLLVFLGLCTFAALGLWLGGHFWLAMAVFVVGWTLTGTAAYVVFRSRLPRAEQGRR